MIVERREIKPSKIPPSYSATPEKPKLKPKKPKPVEKPNDYIRSWKYD